MGGFSADWLSLREPCDTRSRSEELARVLRARLPRRPLQAVDLGTGTAANIRFLAPRLGGEQHWLAIDDDPLLIALQSRALHGPDFHCSVSVRQLDLASGLDALPLAGSQLVTASALLDLVSAPWLQGLARRCEQSSATVLFALTYDGRIQCAPCDPDDDWIRSLVNLHQQGDKGFGPALGPAATYHAREVFEALGYETRMMASDWVLEPDEGALQGELIDGWVQAARELAAVDGERIAAWGTRRRRHLAKGESRLRVGHHDFIAWPTAAAG